MFIMFYIPEVVYNNLNDIYSIIIQLNDMKCLKNAIQKSKLLLVVYSGGLLNFPPFFIVC